MAVRWRAVTFRAQRRPAGGPRARTGCWEGSPEKPDSQTPEARRGSKYHIWGEDRASELDSRLSVSKSQGQGQNGASGFQEWCLESPKATCYGAWLALKGHLRLSHWGKVIVQLVHSLLPLTLKANIKLFLAFLRSLLLSGQSKVRSKSPQARLPTISALSWCECGVVRSPEPAQGTPLF